MRLVSTVALAIGSVSAAAQPCPSVEEYDEIVRVVTERFFDRTFNGLDWEARVGAHRAELGCTAGAGGVASAVNGLLAELDASHTALYTADDMHYWGLNSFFTFDAPDAYAIDFTGIWPEQHDGTWYARHVFEGSEADEAGVRAGDELIAIDGARFSPLGFGRGAAMLTLSSDGRTMRDVSLGSRRQNLMRAFAEAAQVSAKILTVEEKRVGYFHLWTARDAILESMNAALDEFEAVRVDAVLLDYRGGYGGTSEDYLAKIRESPFLREVPKYFLVDDSVRSGKEMLAGIIKRDRLGTLVGSTTAGYYLGASPFRFFDDKYFLLLAISEGAVPGVGKIEGIGIQPDVFADRCQVHCSGRDPQFERAIALIRG